MNRTSVTHIGWTEAPCVVYGDVQEILPDDMPEPLGKAVVTTTTMDANLNHCLVTEFRQPLQVQSHLEMPGILVQLGHTQRT